ncbi:MAG: nitrous oxide reductase accessory protein NosL [Magnetospirillum sp. WYHS-4]
MGGHVVPPPAETDTCVVCGMFVAKYPQWVATVFYKDGHAHHFDGAKDMFKYLLDLPRYAPKHRAEDIAVIAVSEYYDLAKVDARQAFYVTGSDVLGPMGHELVPLATQVDADEFLRDHKGKRILRFGDVTPALVKELDR